MEQMYPLTHTNTHIYSKQTDMNLSIHSWDYETERDWDKINFLGDKCPDSLLPVRSNTWFPETEGGGSESRAELKN